MIFSKVHLANHGLTGEDVGQVFHWRGGRLRKVTGDEVCTKRYGDWTVVSSIIDNQRFECFTGEDIVLSLATGSPQLYGVKNESE